jgi:sulfiredoxin
VAELLKVEKVPVADVRVPMKRKGTLDQKKVDEIAESMLASGQLTPILVRRDGERFVLVEGLHRLEACKALGETTIKALLVQARRG